MRHDDRVAKNKQKNQKAEKKTKKAQKTGDSAEKQLKAAVKKLQTQLAASERSVAKWKARAKQPAPVVSAAPAPVRSATPDETWTVTALRAEARSRGVPGYSRKTKVDLLADLRG